MNTERNALQSTLKIVLIIIVLIVSLIFYLYNRDYKVVQSVELVSKNKRAWLAFEYNRKHLNSQGFSSSQGYYEAVKRLKVKNPYLNENELYILHTNYGLGSISIIGNYDQIKKAKCSQYQLGLQKLEEAKAQIEKQKLIKKRADELESIDCE